MCSEVCGGQLEKLTAFAGTLEKFWSVWGIIGQRLQGCTTTAFAVFVSELVDVSQIGFNGCVLIVVLLGMLLQVRCL